ncbi:hypothetical protein K501DRAFT_271720 [Backusella circina FSU 941]|nr:hypothetical protein K501DRAFT_271720 [Backusella circina FSU 941]
MVSKLPEISENGCQDKFSDCESKSLLKKQKTKQKMSSTEGSHEGMASIYSAYSSDDLSTIPNTPTTNDFMSLKPLLPSDNKRVRLLEEQIRKLNQREHQLRLKLKKRVCRHNDQGETIWQGPHWTGCELPLLFDLIKKPTRNGTLPQLILSLKNCISHLEQTEKSAPIFAEIHAVLDSIYTANYCTFAVDYNLIQRRDRDRLHRLLTALDKSLERNQQLEKETNFLIHKYQSTSSSQAQELCQLKKQLAEQTRLAEREEHQKQESFLNRSSSINSTSMLSTSENQNYQSELFACKKERDQLEITVESMQRQINHLTEELEDTKQQRTRFKSQANRLRVGLEAIQRRNQNSDDEQDEQEGNESLRLMYNEAERKATDLDRESKRQILAMNSLREELKSIHEKHNVLKMESQEKINILEMKMNSLKQEASSLAERKTLTKTSSIRTMSSVSQFDLEAAQADASSQKSRVQQLERQCYASLELKENLKEVQLTFQNELEQEKLHVRTLANQIRDERTVWEENIYQEFQKRYDIDRIQLTRQIRTLSFRLSELEEEIERQRSQHQHELTLIKTELISESEKKLLKLKGLCRKKETGLTRENESLSLKNQTLHEELMAVYCKNIMFAEQLGKLK